MCRSNLLHRLLLLLLVVNYLSQININRFLLQQETMKKDAETSWITPDIPLYRLWVTSNLIKAIAVDLQIKVTS